MNLEKLNPWFNFISNIGVIVGLLFLGYQINQDSRASNFEAVQANRVQRIEYMRANQDPQFAKLWIKAQSGEELTPEENYRWGQHLSEAFGLTYFEWVQREMGIGIEFIQSDVMNMNGLLSHRGARDWWHSVGTFIYPGKFSTYVNNWIEQVPPRTDLENKGLL